MKPLTPEQHKALLAHLSRMEHDYWSATLELIARTGARTAEALMVTRPDFDLQAGEVKIQGVKGSKTRMVPIDGPAARRIMEGISRPPDTAQATQSRRLRREWDRLRFWLFGQSADGVTLHGLRATIAHRAFDASGNNILVAQEILGHVNVANTGRYLEKSRLREHRKGLLKAIG